MRLLIPTLNNKGGESEVSMHFGRAPYLALVEADKSRILSISFEAGEGPHEERNEEDASRSNSIHDRIISMKPDVVIASMIGPGAISAFSRAGIRIVPANGKTLNEVVISFLASGVQN